MKCAGCGSRLPAGSGRGRPARYHNATCRQRARRARLATTNSELLDALAAVESATSEVRRAVLAGESPDEAGHQLAQVAAELTQRLGRPRPGLASAPAAACPVTKSVTPPSGQTEPPSLIAPVTKSVTEEAHRAPRRRTRSTQPEPLDFDTVRQERSTDPLRPGWRVVAGAADAPVVVGFLESVLSVTGRRSSRWEAWTAHRTLLPGRPCRNRNEALIRLLDAYQRAAVHMSRTR